MALQADQQREAAAEEARRAEAEAEAAASAREQEVLKQRRKVGGFGEQVSVCPEVRLVRLSFFI